MPLIDGARFGHVNLTGRDWRRLAAFYTEVFGCTFVPPERDYRSADLDAATGLTGAHLTGAHLRLPGGSDAGPTLEIYAYDTIAPHPGAALATPGLAISPSRCPMSRPRWNPYVRPAVADWARL